MFSVIFESVIPQEKRAIFDLLSASCERLEADPGGPLTGFVDNERFRKARVGPGGGSCRISTWRDEKVRCEMAPPSPSTTKLSRARPRRRLFQDYHLRVGEVVSGYGASPRRPFWLKQRLDETEVRRWEVSRRLPRLCQRRLEQGSLAPSELADRLSLDRTHSAPDRPRMFFSSNLTNAGKTCIVGRGWRDPQLRRAVLNHSSLPRPTRFSVIASVAHSWR